MDNSRFLSMLYMSLLKLLSASDSKLKAKLKTISRPSRIAQKLVCEYLHENDMNVSVCYKASLMQHCLGLWAT